MFVLRIGSRSALVLVACLTALACGGGGGTGTVARESPGPLPGPDAPIVAPAPWPGGDAAPTEPTGGAVGYEPRACGFDLDADGFRGQPDDCRVCDGSTSDIDGDGLDDRLVYVDCDRASTSGEGTAQNPYVTIGQALASLPPPESETIQAVCFRGTCREAVRPTRSGAVGRATLEGFERARFPALLSGWDADADGVYPPMDPDDVAVLDGSGGLDFAIVNDGARSRLEFAHFTARGFGRHCPAEGGFFRPALGGSAVTDVSVHDVELLEINGGCDAASGRAVFLLFMEGSPLSFFRISNVRIDGYGGYAIRGSGVGAQILGPYRFDRLTVRPRGPAGGFAHGIKLWDHIDGVEVLQSLFDADPSAWRPCASRLDVEGCEPTYAITAAQCSRGWTIRGNEFRDWKYAIGVQPDAGPAFCRSRDMDGITIDDNLIVSDYAPWRYGDVAIRIDAGEGATVLGVDITNNTMRTTTGWESCLWSNVGVESKVQSGLVRILGNACIGPINRYAALTVGAPDGEGGEATNPQHRYEVRENLFAQVGTVNVNTGYDVRGLALSGNVYDPDAGFSWAHDAAGEVLQPTLEEWSALSGEDPSSIACHGQPIAGAVVCR